MIPKRDRFGIFHHIEERSLAITEQIIEASLKTKIEKRAPLDHARINIEVLKRLIRITNELKIIDDKTYIKLEKTVQEISRMVNGWRKYCAPTSNNTEAQV